MELEPSRMLLIFRAVGIGKGRKGMPVERTMIVHTPMDNEPFSFFLLDKGGSTVGTLKDQRRDKGPAGSESVAAYLAEKLSSATRIIVEILMGRTTVRTSDSRIDFRIGAAANRFDGFTE